MRLRHLSLLLAFLAALSLPFQAVAGLVMTMTGEGGSVAVMDDSGAAMADDCPMHSHHEQKKSPDHSRCGHCGVCHLASTGFLTPDHVKSDLLPAVETYAFAADVSPLSHIPEPPQHPPRRSV